MDLAMRVITVLCFLVAGTLIFIGARINPYPLAKMIQIASASLLILAAGFSTISLVESL